MKESRSNNIADCLAEGAVSPLENALSALTIILDAMEKEGFQPKGDINAVAAVYFVERLPMYWGALSLILHDMQATVDSLKRGVDFLYKTHQQA